MQVDFIKDFHSKAQEGDSATHEFEIPSKKSSILLLDFQLLVSKRKTAMCYI